MRALLLLGVATAGLAADRVIPADVVIGGVSFADGGKTLVGCGTGGWVRAWDAATGSPSLKTDPPAAPQAVAMLPEMGQLARVTAEGAIDIVAVAGGKAVQRVPALLPVARRLVFSTDGRLVATTHQASRVASENTVRVRDASGREKFSAPAGLGGISALGFSPDGRFLVAGSNDADLRVWNAQNGELVRLIDELLVAMFAIAFSPDGTLLATAGVDRTVYLWDTRTWKLARKLTGQSEMISAVAFSPDGRRLVTGGFSELFARQPVKLLLWDTDSGRILRTMDAPKRVSGVAFSPNGKTVAAAYSEKAVSLYQVAE